MLTAIGSASDAFLPLDHRQARPDSAKLPLPPAYTSVETLGPLSEFFTIRVTYKLSFFQLIDLYDYYHLGMVIALLIEIF
jgi:hypothetical protein